MWSTRPTAPACSILTELTGLIRGYAFFLYKYEEVPGQYRVERIESSIMTCYLQTDPDINTYISGILQQSG